MGDVDADTRALLERMARDLANAPVNATIAERRALMLQMARDYGPAPAPVARKEDRTIHTAHGQVAVRIYWPLEQAPAKPLLVHIHGGGWAIGDPDAYEPVCRGYCAASGAVVVDVHYRRAPEHKHPAALEDCEAALDWAAKNAIALGANPGCIIVTGDSAGGNLAAALCQRTSVSLARQILLYPVMTARSDARFTSRQRFGDGRYFLREADIKNAEREYLARPEDGDDVTVSPLSAPDAVLAQLPPTLIITAEFDPLRDEGEAYAHRLRSMGVDVRYECALNTIHGFVLFAGLIAKGADTIQLIGETIRRSAAARTSERAQS
jgi:acetyl esterase